MLNIVRFSLVLDAIMATVFENVQFSVLSENGDFKVKFDQNIKLEINTRDFEVELSIINGKQVVETVPLSKDVETAKVGEKGVVVSTGDLSVMLKFSGPKEQTSFSFHLKEAMKNKKQSVFCLRTDAASAEQYFQFYSYLSQQQNMMQDYVRTSTYQKAMLDNTVDFVDKVVMDVGAGSGILSFFAVQAGAKKVYAVEASSMAMHCEQLVKTNNMTEKIKVIAGKIEEIELPEKVDIIISEPMGYMLYNERMLETYLHGKKWLKPGGRMFPTQGDLHIAPFTDDALYMEQFSKANFWYQPSFHGVDLSHLREAAVIEYFKQPIVDTFDIRICLARTEKFVLDFETANETDLHNIDIPVSFNIHQSGTIHGLAFWFDVAFIGSQNTVWLSTSPTQPLTHWYQVRCLLRDPIFVKHGQILKGRVHLRANKRQSYDVDIELGIAGTPTKSSNTLDLKNPFFRYTGQQPQPPPGTNNQSPTETYWNLQDLTAQNSQNQQQQLQQGGQQVAYNLNSLLNGGLGDGQIIVQQQAVAAADAQQMVGQQQLPQQQQGAVQTNLVPLANIAPVNPGSIPAATIVSAGNAANQALQTRTSIGGGISPNAFHNGTQQFSVSHQFMIGDYAVPGNLTISSQPLDSIQFKS